MDRTTGVSIFRLSELDKRFGASSEVRYELSILAVMCSVIEANLNIICTNLPTLGYKVFSDWFERHMYGGVYAGALRQLTIGNGPTPVHVREDIELHDIAEHHRRDEDRVIDSSTFELPSDVPFLHTELPNSFVIAPPGQRSLSRSKKHEKFGGAGKNHT